MPPAHLTIGTSTNRINLLNPGGYMLNDWIVGGYEPDTVFQESQLADFRQMVAYRDVTTIDRFDLVLRSGKQDQAARAVQDLRALVRDCLNFWTTTWETNVVYLASQASCETNMRYSVVYDARLVGESNPLGQPFVQAGNGAVMDELALIVERGPWLENAPGTGTGVYIGATQTYDGRTVGNVDSTGTEVLSTAARTVFAANKHNVAQLTDVWYWDDSGPAWVGANLMDAALPFDLLPAVPAVDDFVVFGIDTWAGGVYTTDSGPFCSLVFDIGTAQTDLTIEWRYCADGDGDDPANWTALDVQDNTNDEGDMTDEAFNTTGINSVHWEQNQTTAWVQSNPNPGAALGITGFFVCAYVTAIGAAPDSPQQQNRDIYTVTWPYIDIDADQTDGDMPSLLRLSVDTRSAQDAAGTTTDLWCQRVIAGLRQVDRGENFTSYINLAQEQNNADILVEVAGGTTNFAEWVVTATGWMVEYIPVAVNAWAYRARVRLTSDWYGRYHAFLRGKQQAGVAGCVNIRLGYSPAAAAWPSEKYTDTKHFINTNGDQLLDFGEIVIGPAADVSPLEIAYTYIMIDANCTDAGGATVRLYELILIPVDEWAIDSEDTGKNASAVGYTNDYWSHLEIDAIRNQRRMLSVLIGTASGRIARQWRPITNGIPILHSGKHQRLWLLATKNYPYNDTDNVLSDCELCHTVQVWKNQRYTTLRGDR